MSKQLLKAGDIIKSDGNEFEVVTISSQFDKGGKPVNFHYDIVSKVDADALREAEAKSAQAEREKAAANIQE